MGLFEELKRRRVFRVTVAYVVGAWAVLQGADTLFPALHLPPSAVTLVAAVVVLAFPAVTLLAWAFDTTPSGIRRSPGSLRVPAWVAALGTVVLALGVTSFITLRRRAVAARLDPDAVAILPFRVSGDATLAGMREGMVDLLAVKLTGEGGGPRAFDSRTTLSAWHRKVRDEDDDMPTADAVQLARTLGAGQILLGELVGTPGRVALSVTLRSSVDGRALAGAQDAAAPDSILPLVDHVVARLLSRQAGEGRRAEALLSESLPAVRAYLEGQRLLRRGDYETAMQRFNTALEDDSTFALAGLGLAEAAAWTESGTALDRGRGVALRYRARLPLPDREFVDAAYGSPQETSALERVQLLRDMVARAPDRIEAWYALGDLYYHYGGLIGVDDPFGKAMDAWQHALALDSMYMPAVEHQFAIYAQRGDTLGLRRLADFVYGRLPALKYRLGNPWVAALALRDETWLGELRARVDSLDLFGIASTISLIMDTGVSQQDLPQLLDLLAEKAGADAESFPWLALMHANLGRPAEGLAIFGNAPPQARDLARLAVASVHGVDDGADVAGLARRMAGDGAPFMAGEYCLAHADVRCLRDAATALRARADSLPPTAELAPDEIDGAESAKIAAAMITAGLESVRKEPTAGRALARADSLLTHTTMSMHAVPGMAALLALASARTHAAIGDVEGEYAAAKRGAAIPYDMMTSGPLLLEYARAAARLDKGEEAIDAYRRFLELWQQPGPGLPTELSDQARRELARLAGEPLPPTD